MIYGYILEYGSSLVPRLPPLARNYCVTFELTRKSQEPGNEASSTQGGAVNITCVQYLLIQQFYAIHFAIHLVLPVVCDIESFLVVCECRDSDQS